MVISKHLIKSGAHWIAFVAFLAERLLPLYISYAAKTSKGRPELLREVLDTMWQTAKGRSFPTSDLQDLARRIDQGALDSQDSEGWSAWSPWRTVQLALECCGSAENQELAEEAAVVAYERVAGSGAERPKRLEKSAPAAENQQRDYEADDDADSSLRNGNSGRASH